MNGVAYLSKSFDWFAEDFSAQAGTVLQYVAQYIADPELARDVSTRAYRIDYLDYDWGLNGVSPTESAYVGSSR